LEFSNVVEVNFGGHAPDRHQANMRAYMWNQCKEWLSHGAIDPNDEKLANDLAGPGYGINHSNQLVLESKADMQKRGQASPDDGDALALTFAQPVAPAEKEDPDEDEEFKGLGNWNRGPGGWMRN
jgi:phage terminase large subunit